MKKIFVTILMVLAIFALVACGTEETTEETSEIQKDTSTESKTQENTTIKDSTNDNEDSIASDIGQIKSVGPNGEIATPASLIKLTDEEIEEIKAGNYKAAISFHYGGNDWSASQLQGLRDTFAKLDIEIVGVTDADFAPEQQVSDLETLMALNPDILISIPTDPTATADAFQRIADAGVKIVFMDNVPEGFTAGDNYVSCVSADNYGNGVIAADLIGEALGGKGKVGVVYFDVDFFVTNQRLEAFEKTMADKYPEIEIVTKMPFQDTNDCSQVTDAMITQYPNLDAIFAHWDVPAEGVLSSLRAAGMNDVVVSTIDLGNNIAKEIAEGNVIGLGAQLPYDQGVTEATLAAYALFGKDTPPYVAVPAKRVDNSNIIEAYEQVYYVSAPDWLVEAKNNN